MNTMNSNIKIILLALVTLNVSCGPSSSNQVSKTTKSIASEEQPPAIEIPEEPLPPTLPPVDDDNSGDNDEVPVTDNPNPDLNEELCYYEKQNTKEVCLPLSLATNDELSTRYNYLNPKTDSSFPRGSVAHQYRSPMHFLNLKINEPSTQLTQHFKLDELMQIKKGPYGLFSPLVLFYVEQLRSDVGKSLNINSGYRSPGYNALIGGAKWSRHMYGDAIDFTISGRTLKQAKDLCLKHGASFYQLYKTHIHCDWRNSPLDENLYGPQLTGQAVFNYATAEKHSEIQVNQLENGWILSVDTEFVEDSSEELSYEWTIRNGKEVWSEDNPTVVLPKSKKAYIVEVLVGGSMKLRTQINPNK